MNVLLVNPPFYRYGGMEGHGGHLIPLNLCCLAGHARERHPDSTFRIMDAEALGYSLEETAAEAKRFDPGLIGITTTTSAFDAVIELTRLMKAAMPDVPIVLGGPHASAIPERSLHESSADFVVIGEGELTFDELIGALAEAGTDPPRVEALRTIRGLAYRDDEGRVSVNAPRERNLDLDSLPFPARDLVNNAVYCPPPSKRVSLGPNTLISTSRGCPHNCGFCATRSVWGRRVKYRSAASVVEEIRECVERFGITSVNFTDEYFTARKSRVLEICRLMIDERLDVPWVCSARAEKLDEETLRTMKAAGCREISFGIESGCPEILERIDKKCDLDEARRVVGAARRAGITTHASYILGYVGETEDTIRRTIRFAQRLNTHVAAFFIAIPLPGSRLYDEAVAEGYLRPDATWRDFSPLSRSDAVMDLPGLPPEKVRAWHRRALKSYYIRPSYILMRLAGLRHWYEVKNLLAGLKILFSLKK